MTDGTVADPFWNGLDNGQFRVQRCGQCGTAFFPPAPICPRCHATDVSWIDTDGTGDLYAYSRLHRTAPGVPEPIVLGIVELAEGPRVLARVDAPVEDLNVGVSMRLRPWAYDEGVDRGHLSDRPFFRAHPDE